MGWNSIVVEPARRPMITLTSQKVRLVDWGFAWEVSAAA